MKDAAHAVKLARGAMNKQGNAIGFGKKLSARQPVATAGTGHRRSIITTIFPRIYARTYYAHPCARVMSFSFLEEQRWWRVGRTPGFNTRRIYKKTTERVQKKQLFKKPLLLAVPSPLFYPSVFIIKCPTFFLCRFGYIFSILTQRSPRGAPL
jgi:hypothetical protein